MSHSASWDQVFYFIAVTWLLIGLALIALDFVLAVEISILIGRKVNVIFGALFSVVPSESEITGV